MNAEIKSTYMKKVVNIFSNIWKPKLICTKFDCPREDEAHFQVLIKSTKNEENVVRFEVRPKRLYQPYDFDVVIRLFDSRIGYTDSTDWNVPIEKLNNELIVTLKTNTYYRIIVKCEAGPVGSIPFDNFDLNFPKSNDYTEGFLKEMTMMNKGVYCKNLVISALVLVALFLAKELLHRTLAYINHNYQERVIAYPVRDIVDIFRETL